MFWWCSNFFAISCLQFFWFIDHPSNGVRTVGESCTVRGCGTSLIGSERSRKGGVKGRGGKERQAKWIPSIPERSSSVGERHPLNPRQHDTDGAAPYDSGPYRLHKSAHCGGSRDDSPGPYTETCSSGVSIISGVCGPIRFRSR